MASTDVLGSQNYTIHSKFIQSFSYSYFIYHYYTYIVWPALKRSPLSDVISMALLDRDCQSLPPAVDAMILSFDAATTSMLRMHSGFKSLMLVVV